MPTIDDFKTLNPSSFSNYGGDRGNVNLLISSSVSASVNIAPYFIQGMTFPLKSQEGVAITNALKEVEKITFTYAGKTETATVTNRTNRGTHFFLTVQPVELAATASTDAQGIPRELLSHIVFTPFLTSNFNNSDDNPLLSNSSALKLNSVAKVVDRNSSQFQPTNLDAIIAGTAQPAQIQDCSYTKTGYVNGRYDGSKLTSGSVVGDDPALKLVSFEASIHPSDADNATIKGIQLSDREILDIRFNTKRIATGSTFAFQSFPSGSNILFREEKERILRLADAKVYSIEKDEIYVVGENGIVSSVD